MNPDFVNDLARRFTGDIRFDPASRILYSTDASIYQIEPLGVAFPRTQEDLSAAVELAAKYRVPILPRGSGSSLAGQAIGEALILDCSRWLDSIVEIDPESRTATVEPGVVLATLNRAAAKHGLTFGPDPASAERATMGGVIANNATGAHSILYGMAADHLVSADVVMADGSLATWGDVSDRLSVNSNRPAVIAAAFEIREKYADAIKQNYPVSWRNSAGYRLNYLLPFSWTKPPRWEGDYPDVGPSAFNLAHLLAGSEGTLAVIRRARVKLVEKPKHTILGILSYSAIADACDDVPRLLEFRPSAIELIPRMILRLARTVPAYAAQMGWIDGDPAAVLVVEFGGDQPKVLLDAVRGLREDVLIAESVEDQARVWNVRKVGLGILDSRPQSARPVAFIEDCAIPVERLGEFVRETERLLAEHGTEGGIYAHASAGCLHIRPILDLKTGEGVRSMRRIAEQTLETALRLGGSMSSEHGDGIARGEWLEKTYGVELVGAMRRLKRAADPDNLLNPRKMFDAPPMDSRLRYGESHRAQAWAPAFDFSRNGGLVTAIEQCNGQGVCRKDTGVMCPSFQATREEMHSTRGRANLLRAMIRTGIGNRKSEIKSAVREALDLCLACKGCKSECPSGVDMAKLKFAFEAEYFKTHRRPLRDYLFGYFHVTARIASALAPLSNVLTRGRAFRNLAAKVFGITPHRPFPSFAAGRAHSPVAGGRGGKVIFLPDPFSRYVEPQVEQAAFDILSGLGLEIQVLPSVGSGASLLSGGFIEAARRHAGGILDALKKLDPENTLPIIGIEPPEIYSLKHDYADLLPERAEEIATRARRAWLLEEFLIRRDEFQELRVVNIDKETSLSNFSQKVHFHPHCHQRAEALSPDDQPIGVNATVAVLRACGYDVELIDAGCCGMAGTFGYEAEHYELSQKIGELALFPHIRNSGAADRELIVSSTGAACRLQIEQGTGVCARHPVTLIRDRLGGAQ